MCLCREWPLSAITGPIAGSWPTAVNYSKSSLCPVVDAAGRRVDYSRRTPRGPTPADRPPRAGAVKVRAERTLTASSTVAAGVVSSFLHDPFAGRELDLRRGAQIQICCHTVRTRCAPYKHPTHTVQHGSASFVTVRRA